MGIKSPWNNEKDLLRILRDSFTITSVKMKIESGNDKMSVIGGKSMIVENCNEKKRKKNK